MKNEAEITQKYDPILADGGDTSTLLDNKSAESNDESAESNSKAQAKFDVPQMIGDYFPAERSSLSEALKAANGSSHESSNSQEISSNGKIFCEILKLVVPYSFAQLLSMVGEFGATYIMADLGEEQLAASGLVGMVQAFFFGILTTALHSVSVLSGDKKGLVKQGKSDDKSIGQVFQTGWVLAALLSVPLLTVSIFLKSILVSGFKQPENLANIAGNFFLYRSFSTPFLTGLMVNQQFALGMEEPKIPSVTSITNTLFSAGLGYVLSLGKFGFPKLKEIGLAYAFATSTILHFFITTAYLKRSAIFGAYQLFKWNSLHLRHRLGEMAKLGFSFSLQAAAEITGLSGATFLVGLLGQQALSVQQAVVPYFWLFLIPTFATSEAVGGLISKHNRGSDISQVRRYGNSSIVIATLLSVVGFVVFYAAGDSLASFLIKSDNPDRETIISQAKILFFIQGIVLISDSFRTITFGLLRGLQDKAFPGYTAILSTIVGLGAGLGIGYYGNAGVNGVHIGRGIGIGVSTLLLLNRWRQKSKSNDGGIWQAITPSDAFHQSTAEDRKVDVAVAQP